jgi:hypothetical protein
MMFVKMKDLLQFSQRTKFDPPFPFLEGGLFFVAPEEDVMRSAKAFFLVSLRFGGVLLMFLQAYFALYYCSG